MSANNSQFDPGALGALAAGLVAGAFTFTTLGGIASLDLAALFNVLASFGVIMGTLIAYGRYVQP